MRANVKDFFALVTTYLQFPEPIFEVGSYIVKGQEALADLRPLFPNKAFIGTDMRDGLGVDEVDNIEYLRCEDGAVGSLVCIDTVQCVRNLWKARSEMHRALAAKGILFIASAMDAPFYHYDVNARHAEMLAKDKNQAHNI